VIATVLAVLAASIVAAGAGAGAMRALGSQRTEAGAGAIVLRGMRTQGAYAGAICAVVGGLVGLVMSPAIAAGAGLTMAIALLWLVVAPRLPVRALDRALIGVDTAGPDKTAALASVRDALAVLAGTPKIAAQLPFLCMATARRLFEAGVPTAALEVLRILEGREVTAEELAKLAFSRAVYAFYAGDVAGARAALDRLDPKSTMAALDDVRVLDAQLLVREQRAPEALTRIAKLDSAVAHAVAAHAHAALGDDPKAELALDKIAPAFHLVLNPEGPASSLARRRAEKSAYRG
jgi:hypothetical protein